jgi:hypothetical protein
VIDRVSDYPKESDEFAGLYGYQMTYSQSGFLHDSDRFFVISSEIKGQERIYIVDLASGELRHLNLDSFIT